MLRKKPLVLMILDGWGYREETTYNAIAYARTPQWDRWWQDYPHLLLDASGSAVGLPTGQMGNSEVGHMHIGAGRVIYQDLVRINDAIKTGDFFNNSTFLAVIANLKTTKNALHIIGLLSDGGVHSHQAHLLAFLTLCHQQKFSNIYLHLILDGRDTSIKQALTSIEMLNQHLSQYPGAVIVSITGRYFAMDRDKRWERVALFYQLLTEGISHHHFNDAKTALDTFYLDEIHDEFIPPTMIGDACPIMDGDSIFFFNFRADRARQLTQTFVDNNFQGFMRLKRPILAHFMTMTCYAQELTTCCAFPSNSLTNTLGALIARANLTQLRIAETEKYAHITFFLNGGCEQIFVGEKRILIPSPNVETYDKYPTMSALSLTTCLIDAINSEAYDVIICNYANADMVGHTGNFNATVKAIECLDTCMSHVGQLLIKKNGALVITADHGNAESMFDATLKQPRTTHTCNPVPFLYVGDGWQLNQTTGSLIDLAPTLLALLEIDKPAEMTGCSLLVANHDRC
jgi:2,3-bisphosphoglycerate-independent phosphoglycerate mutase